MVRGHAKPAAESDAISVITTEAGDDEEQVVYNTEDFISKPYFSPNCSMSEDTFVFDFSYGYESIKRYNICIPDENHVIHWSGAIMTMVNINNLSFKFRRCCDQGYGFITKHPSRPYLAVGEKGVYPYIIIYEWPNFNIIQIMKRGTKKSYSFLDFSPDGELLASQGGPPDHTLTLWHWEKGWVLLRCKAHTQDVYRTEFSRHYPGRLTSSGSGHIKFWTMADTFTGLKLQGKLGKFGKTPISDTTCFYGLSDGLILSAAENGNMLVWEYLQIKMEVVRGKSDPCHNGVINFFEYDVESGDLFTLGSEGKMRCWELASILKGKPKGDRKYVSGLASYEVDIKDDFGIAEVQYILKMSNNPESPLFYHYVSQDSKGSIWKLHLELQGNQQPPVRLFIKHKGPIVGMGVSPGDYYVATLGIGGKLLVHNMKTNRAIIAKQFSSFGSALLWIPGTMVCALGFRNGVLKLIVLSVRQADAKSSVTLENVLKDNFVSCIQAIKPHASSISCFSMSKDLDYLASGSEDSTIFIYRVNPFRDYFKLIPIALMTGPGPIYSISWKRDEPSTILASCTNAILVEVTFEGLMEVKSSDNYATPISVSNTYFKSVKSEILRDTVAKAVIAKKADKLAKKKEKLAKMKEDNPGLILDEAVFFQDSDEEMELPPLYYPPKACTIFFAKYVDGRYWLSPSGYDAGFIYLYNLGSDSPNECIPIFDAGDIEISECTDILDGRYTVLGLGNGKIRLVKIDPTKPFDYSDYLEVVMHDCQYGRITKICYSHDLRFIYSCGTDSNIFSYKLRLSDDEYLPFKHLPQLMPVPDYAIEGKIPDDQPSLQEINATAKLKELEGEAAEMMFLKIKELKSMGEKLKELWDLNDLLPKDVRLTVTDMELHPKFTRFLKQEFEEKLSIWEKKLQFDYEKAKILYKKVYNHYFKPIACLDVYLKCLNSNSEVKTFRTRRDSKQLVEAKKFIAKFMEKRQADTRTSKDLPTVPVIVNEKKKPSDSLPALEKNLEKYVPLLSPQEKILYDAFQKRRQERSDLLIEIEEGRPDMPKESSQDNPASSSKQGRKLKTDPSFRLPFSKRITKQLKLVHILRTLQEVQDTKDNFNKKILSLRESKGKEMAKFRQNVALHQKILDFLPEEEVLNLPVVPPIDLKSEYPELYYAAETGSLERNRGDEVEEYQPELEILDPQVIKYYKNAEKRSADLEEYYAINIAPGITRLKKLQEKMIYETNTFIDAFDNRVKDLLMEKMEVAFNLVKRQLYLGTLLQEISIISRFQFLEESTQRAMRSYLAIKALYTFKLFVRRKRIAKKENNIDAFNDKIKDIVTEFQNMVAGSKFAKHLTRIFKKKYKPPKKNDDDESESESSSSEDESSSEKDEDEGEEMAAYKFDETICPDGCDPYIFNRLFKLRQSRHEYEAKVLNSKKDIASNQHEMVGMKRILKIDGVLLAIYQLQLDRISRQKQGELNQVNLLLIINSSQLQNWQTEKKQYIHPKDLVVASVKAIKELRESKRQLSITTSTLKVQSKEHDLHKMHLKKDIMKFEEIHKHLLAERKETLIQKFGIETNVYTLDVESTRRLLLSKAYDVVLDERFGLLKQLKDRMYEEKEKLAALKKMHANNLFTLAAIESEKYKSIKEEQKLKKKHLHEYITEEQLDIDLQNLQYILCQQRALKERLKSEIRFLKFRDLGPVAKKTETVGEGESEKASIAEVSREPSTAEADLSISPEAEETEAEIREVEQEEETILAEEAESVALVEEQSKEIDQEEYQFEDIFTRILKDVVPSETLIEEGSEEVLSAHLSSEERTASHTELSGEEIPVKDIPDEPIEEEDVSIKTEEPEEMQEEKEAEKESTDEEGGVLLDSSSQRDDIASEERSEEISTAPISQVEGAIETDEVAASTDKGDESVESPFTKDESEQNEVSDVVESLTEADESADMEEKTSKGTDEDHPPDVASDTRTSSTEAQSGIVGTKEIDQ